MSILLSCPEEYFRYYFINFLCLKDVVALDSALVQHCWRSEFHSRLNDCYLMGDGVTMVDSYNLKWFHNKKLSMVSIRITDKLLSTEMLPQWNSLQHLILEDFHQVTTFSMLRLPSLLSIEFQDCQGLHFNSDVVKIFTENSPRLESFKCLDNIHLSDTCILHIAHNCPNLKLLWIWNSIQEENTMLQLVKSCPSLTSLTLLRCNAITMAALQELSHCCLHLKTLIFDRSDYLTNNNIIELVPYWTGLEQLQLPISKTWEPTGIRLNGWLAIAQYCIHLTEICLKEQRDTNLILETLVYYHQPNCISKIALQYCHNVDRDVLLKFIQTQSNIRIFHSICTINLCSLCIQDILIYCINLKELQIEGVEGYNQQLFPICASFPQSPLTLQCLSLRNIPVKESHLLLLLIQCKGLRKITLNNSCHLSERDIICISLYCQSLEYIDLDKHCVVTNTALIKLSTHCINLHTIYLQYCHSIITNTAVIYLAQHSKHLQHFSINATLLTDTSILALAEYCPFLHKLVLYKACLLTDLSFSILCKVRRLRCLDVSNELIKPDMMTALGQAGISICNTENEIHD